MQTVLGKDQVSDEELALCLGAPSFQSQDPGKAPASTTHLLTQRLGSKVNGFRGGKQIGFLKNAPLLMIGGVIIHNPRAASVS